MTKQKTTKRALLLSVLSLLLSFSMLIGTTYAWFTDSVTSGNNIIKSGNLDVEMYWADGDEDPTAEATVWTDASEDAIFDYDLWEPGYVQARHLKIANVGTLALKYQLRILANGVVSQLADVIDVYFFADAVQLDRAHLSEANRIGTLSEALNTPSASLFTQKVAGSLEAGASNTVTLAMKMQESAGNEYQDLSIGSDFSIQLLATQLTSEEDSFDKFYDDKSDFASQDIPSATVFALTGDELNINYTLGIGGAANNMTLDAGYSFQPTETYEQALASEYANAHADFYIYADSKVEADSLAVAGYYEEWCKYNSYNWVALTAPDIAANQPIRLIADGMNGGDTEDGITVPYSAICQYGNDGIGFKCGIADLNGSNAGTTVTVELRIYETYSEEECLELFGYKSANKETGEFITVGIFTYTLGGEYVTADNGAVYFYGNDGSVTLYDASDVQTAEFVIPEGVTALGNYALTGASAVKTVILPSTVTKIGRAFDTSTVEKVVLNEGLEKIDSRAFKETKNLKEVVIPSTVKVIEDNAFQKTWLESITIPATVETIGETAFGASKIRTVTIEGNTSIQGYAFRGCVELRTVYLNGEDVSFIASTLNNRNSTWFCNGESNNANTSNITFYVANETVAARVKIAMGAEAGNTPVILNGQALPMVTVANKSQLQSALDSAADGTVIVLTNDIIGDVVATQKKDIDITVNGNGKKFNGVFTVYGKGKDATRTETFTIKNVNFVAASGAQSCIVSPDKQVYNGYSYSHNVTVDNCTFTDPDGTVNCAAIRHQDGGDEYWTVKNCTVDDTMHSILQVNNVEGKLIVDNCIVNSKNGANFNSCTNVEMTKCNFDVKGYAVRFGVGSGGNLGTAKSYVLTENVLKSACDDGEAVIMFRASAVDAVLTLNDTVLSGTLQISGNTNATTIIYN